MSNRRTPSTQTTAPDADRDGLHKPPPEWLVHVLAFIIYFLRKHLSQHRLPSWWLDRPDLPPGSAQALGAAIRGDFGNAIAWMCRRRGIGPGHKDWPELSRAIVRFGGSVKNFRPGQRACGLQWWENPEIVPGAIGMETPTPAADAMALLLSRQEAANAPPPGSDLAAAVAAFMAAATGAAALAVPPAPGRPVVARAGTGPPTGPPYDPHRPACYA